MHLGIWASGHLGIWASRLLGIWASGHQDIWASGHLGIWTSGHLSVHQFRTILYNIVGYKKQTLKISLEKSLHTGMINFVNIPHSKMMLFGSMVNEMVAQLSYFILRLVVYLYATTVLYNGNKWIFGAALLVLIVRIFLFYGLQDKALKMKTISITRQVQQCEQKGETRSDDESKNFNVDLQADSNQQNWINENPNTEIDESFLPIFSLFCHNVVLNFNIGLFNYVLFGFEIIAVYGLGAVSNKISKIEIETLNNYFGFDLIAVFIVSLLFSFMSSFGYNRAVLFPRGK